MTDVQELRITLTVDDFDAAVRLYRDALGLPELADWSSDRGRVLLLDAIPQQERAILIAELLSRGR